MYNSKVIQVLRLPVPKAHTIINVAQLKTHASPIFRFVRVNQIKLNISLSFSFYSMLLGQGSVEQQVKPSSILPG
jgi:uncharacterized metal-binding protein